MTAWSFIIIIACAVAGFLIVSFVIEAFRSKSEAARPSEPDHGEDAKPDEEGTQNAAWFEVLGVPPTASVGEIKIAYRERVRQYHPDLVAGLGIELKQVAERKMKELNAAYECALRSR